MHKQPTSSDSASLATGASFRHTPEPPLREIVQRFADCHHFNPFEFERELLKTIVECNARVCARTITAFAELSGTF
jgi:hypothetical protein